MRLLAAVLVLAVFVLVLMFRIPAPASRDWKEFAIGPASGISTAINSGRIHADGITLATMLAVAFDIPAVRVIGPDWIARARYTLHAAVPDQVPQSLGTLLRQELEARFHLTAHREDRGFDVWVLSASGTRELERAAGSDGRTMIHERDAQVLDATMDRLAAALQNILGRPVINETGIQGTYNIAFVWGENRETSVVASMRNRFGLGLARANRQMEALVVDRVQPDAVLSLFSGVERVIGPAPSGLRQRLAGALAIH